MQAEKVREKTLYTAAELFLEKGYTETTMRGLAQKAGVDVSGINRAFGCKENILCELVTYVLNGQFETMKALLQGVTTIRCCSTRQKPRCSFIWRNPGNKSETCTWPPIQCRIP